MKFIEKGEKQVSKEDLYQVGNIIKNLDNYFMIVGSKTRNKYAIIDLRTGKFQAGNYISAMGVHRLVYDSLDKLADDMYQEDDILVKGKYEVEL